MFVGDKGQDAVVDSVDQRHSTTQCGRQPQSEVTILKEQPMWFDLDSCYGASVLVAEMDMLIVIVPDGTWKEVGCNNMHGLGLCTYLHVCLFGRI